MSSEINVANVIIRLDKGHLHLDELAQLTGELRTRLENLDVESVDFVREQISLQGAKGTVDPITVGALTVVVVQTVVPKLLELVQTWAAQHKGQTVKVKIQRGNDSVEVELSGTTNPKKMKELVETLTNSMDKKRKHR